jgi:hypothetical protein
MAGSQQDDGDFQSIPKRQNTTKKSLYIGNLPVDVENLEEKLLELLKKSTPGTAIEKQDVTVVRSKNCHALVSCPGNIDDLILKLNQMEFEGKRLSVQRERVQRERIIKNVPDNKMKMYKKKNNVPTASFAKSWSAPKPKKEKQAVKDPVVAPPADIQEASEIIGAIVANEMEQTQKNGEDPLNTVIASSADVSLLAGAGFGLQEEALSTPRQDNNDQQDAATDGGFMARCQQPLSSLMGEYGDYDPNWNQVVPVPDTTETADASTKTPATASDTSPDTPEAARVLGMQGKMPIHIEFTSFGYHHGAPAEVRNGWSHANPLPPFDCRHLATVPNFLLWQDGLSSRVKRALMFNPNKDDTSFIHPKDFTKQVAEEVAVTVIEAIDEGGHGYAQPLRMKIFIGSEAGRHRSVVACELAATAMRKLLRANKDTRFGQPCSVGTRHRQVEPRKSRGKAKVSKQNALEDG